jgi:exopolysaccharide biosynthesis predicted pyruvyltransferase EpsI
MSGAAKSFAKKIMPQPLKRLLRNIESRTYYYSKIKALKVGFEAKRIILIGTPEHGNLGDHAIAEAELKFFSDYFPDIKVIEITADHYRFQKDKILSYIKKTDIICIQGGGFLGSLWIIEEVMARDIISTFIDNKIIILPQTIYFEDSESGQREFEVSMSTYREHDDLKIFLRDTKSINVAKQLVGEENENKLILIPDFALYLNKKDEAAKRDGILFCLREDKERVLSDFDKKKMIEDIVKKGRNINFTTTAIPKRIKIEDRKLELEKKYAEFRGAELVITDRLHGMIFAFITGTPCIALDNLSGKVKGVYQWIKDSEYVKIANSIGEVNSITDKMMRIPKSNYGSCDLVTSFKRLADLIEVR